MPKLVPINLFRWIAENEEHFKPPVKNKCLWQEGDYIVMVVGGPNARTDFHINPADEIFYQIKGDITLVVRENADYQHIPIREGEIFLLPANIPHRPQRPPDTIGLVIEKVRNEQEIDGFEWRCENCDQKLFEAFARITDIEGQLPEIFNRFHKNADHTTCKNCGEVFELKAT